MNSAVSPAVSFKGFYATITNDAGESSPCYVVNEKLDTRFDDGTVGHAYKVKVGYKRLHSAGHRYVTCYSANAGWFKASKITK